MLFFRITNKLLSFDLYLLFILILSIMSEFIMAL